MISPQLVVTSDSFYRASTSAVEYSILCFWATRDCDCMCSSKTICFAILHLSRSLFRLIFSLSRSVSTDSNCLTRLDNGKRRLDSIQKSIGLIFNRFQKRYCVVQVFFLSVGTLIFDRNILRRIATFEKDLRRLNRENCLHFDWVTRCVLSEESFCFFSVKIQQADALWMNRSLPLMQTLK